MSRWSGSKEINIQEAEDLARQAAGNRARIIRRVPRARLPLTFAHGPFVRGLLHHEPGL